jgi:hypothetical protein
VAIVALVPAGWFADVAINSSTHDNVQKRVERAISDGMQRAVVRLLWRGTPLGSPLAGAELQGTHPTQRQPSGRFTT